MLGGLVTAKCFYRSPLPDRPSPSSSAGFAVVELFTSEGCSSCPPADAVLSRLATAYTSNVLLLSFHVDYWNRLGWTDPYSKSEYSDRQRMYATAKGSDGVYTPQTIVNGVTHVVGSEEQKIRTAVDNFIEKQVNEKINLNASLSEDNQSINIDYQYAGKPGTILNIALVQRSTSSNVIAGENSGHKLRHINVVRGFKTVSDKKGTVRFIVPGGIDASECAFAAYTQDKETMHIMGTTMLTNIQ